MRIALTGKTGAGKTTVARCLEARHGFVVCNTGARCRELAREFFGCEEKAHLNRITDAFRDLEPGVWLKVALRQVAQEATRIVIDSIRFGEDYGVARERRFTIWRIEARNAIRVQRLRIRGQGFAAADDEHLSETALDEVPYDVILENNGDSLCELYEKIAGELMRYRCLHPEISL